MTVRSEGQNESEGECEMRQWHDRDVKGRKEKVRGSVGQKKGMKVAVRRRGDKRR